PPPTQTPALATPRQIEQEPRAEDSGDAGEGDRDPARRPGGRGRCCADKSRPRASRQRQATAGAANRILDRSCAEEVHLQLLAGARTGRPLDRLDKSDNTQLDLLGFVE